MEIITAYPFWYSILCIGLGGAYAFLLYYFKDRLFNELKPWVKPLMATFRFITVSIIAFLLLSPLIKTSTKRIEKPIIVIAQDNSESIKNNTNADFYTNTYPKSLATLQEQLGNNFEVNLLSFGDQVKEGFKADYTDKTTDIAGLLDELHNRYDNRNLGAVILASDGIYNRGSNPIYSADKLKTNIYTIALGDTTVRKDLLISKVNYNRTAYLGNSFPIEITVEARQYRGRTMQLTVSKDKETLYSKSIDITSNKLNVLVPVTLDAKAIGMQHYKIALAPMDGELSLANNTKDVYIEVLEGKQKVLILADAPHPDIAAIRQTLEENKSYEVKFSLAKDFTDNLQGYNLVVLYQLPAISNAAIAITNKINSIKTPVLYILGTQTNLLAFNSLKTGLSIDGSGNKPNEFQAYMPDNFSLFTISDALRNGMRQFSPLVGLLGNYGNTTAGTSLLYQQIGALKTTQPLLLFTQEPERRTGILCGEGLWKWRLREYALNNNHNLTNELLLKTVQYLSVKEQKTHFRIINKNNYAENEPLQFDAELYNDNYELVNTPELNLTIVDANNKSYPFTFSKTDKAYTLTTGIFPVGDYRYKANVKLGEKPYTASGAFSITPLQLEANENVADHQLLSTMAHQHGGQMLYPNQMSQLADILKKREDIKSISYTDKRLDDLINLKWLLGLLILLLGAEWFMRKRNGAY